MAVQDGLLAHVALQRRCGAGDACIAVETLAVFRMRTPSM